MLPRNRLKVRNFQRENPKELDNQFSDCTSEGSWDDGLSDRSSVIKLPNERVTESIPESSSDDEPQISPMIIHDNWSFGPLISDYCLDEDPPYCKLKSFSGLLRFSPRKVLTLVNSEEGVKTLNHQFSRGLEKLNGRGFEIWADRPYLKYNQFHKDFEGVLDSYIDHLLTNVRYLDIISCRNAIRLMKDVFFSFDPWLGYNQAMGRGWKRPEETKSISSFRYKKYFITLRKLRSSLKNLSQ